MQERKRRNEIWIHYLNIPVELLGNENLAKIDMFLFAIIEYYDSERGCFASNKHLATILDVTETTISTAVARLKKEEYIYQESFDGRKRVLRINSAYKVLHKETLKKFNDRYKRTLKYNINNEYQENNINKSFSKENDKRFVPQNETPLSENNDLSETPLSEENQNIPLSEENPESIRSKARQMTDDHRQERKETQKEKNHIIPTEDEKDIIYTWNECGATKHKPDTKTYKEMVQSIRKLIQGTFFADSPVKFNRDEIIERINNFALSINIDYEPVNKTWLKKQSFITFLYNPRMTDENKSLFLRYKDPPKLVSENARSKPDKYPDLTQRLKRIFFEGEIGVQSIPATLSFMDENKFISSSYMVREFYNEKRFDFAWGMNPTDLAEVVYRSLVESFGQGNLTVGHLCSKYTYETVLPQYMEKMAMWREK